MQDWSLVNNGHNVRPQPGRNGYRLRPCRHRIAAPIDLPYVADNRTAKTNADTRATTATTPEPTATPTPSPTPTPTATDPTPRRQRRLRDPGRRWLDPCSPRSRSPGSLSLPAAEGERGDHPRHVGQHAPGRWEVTRIDMAKTALTDLVTERFRPGRRCHCEYSATRRIRATRVCWCRGPARSRRDGGGDPERPSSTSSRRRSGPRSSRSRTTSARRRPKIVVLVTDGEETCGGDRAAAIEALADRASTSRSTSSASRSTTRR